MKLLIDMNLSPRWVSVLNEQEHQCVHWSTVGSPSAPDAELMQWAKDRGHVVFTHDLDFGAILAATAAAGPSVIQFRTQDVLPEAAAERIVSILKRFEPELSTGALVVVDDAREKVRILPLA